MRTAARIGLGLLVAVMAAIAWVALDPEPLRRGLVAQLSDDYLAPQVPSEATPVASESGVAVGVEKVASGIDQPTDIQLAAAIPGYALVTSKLGRAYWLSLADGRRGELFTVDVVTVSEQGLLGLALHPDYAENGRLFSNQVVNSDGRDVSRVVEWKVTRPTDLEHATARELRTVMEVEQPYQNHNAGQLVFGPDGMLYVGWGDGGFRDDPGGHGQNPATFLGTMLRIDVDGEPDPGRGYAVPADNPFVGKPGFAPEVFAYGLRNPWRYGFDPRGRLVVADVGQDAWEEVSLVQAGDNLGWPIMEAFVCHAEDGVGCDRKDLVAPIHAYGRQLGSSITGGHVYLGERIPALHGKYVFGDFVSGRLFALELPAERKPVRAVVLGQWPLHVSSFGRDPSGELYFTAFGRGEVYRLVAP